MGISEQLDLASKPKKCAFEVEEGQFLGYHIMQEGGGDSPDDPTMNNKGGATSQWIGHRTKTVLAKKCR